MLINRLRTGIVLLLIFVIPLFPAYAGGITTDPATSEFKVLAIGNSFSVDAVQHLYQIAADAGAKKIIIGNLAIGGCRLVTHYNNAKDNLPKYTYHKNTNGTWTSRDDQTMLYGLQDEDWDIITIQQVSGSSGVLSTYLEGEVLPFLVNYLHENKTNPDAKLLWHMTWAYQQDTKHASFPTYKSNQMEMYNAIVNAVQEAIVPNEGFSFVIPSGTAIQNVRTSYIGDILTRDGYHLSLNLGRYIAGVTWLHAITGWPIDDLGWVPSTKDIPESYLPIIKEAVQNAVKNPFTVTRSSYATQWFASPEPGAVEQPELPVQFKPLPFAVRQVEVKLDGQTLYKADRLPTDLSIKTAALLPGSHLLAATLTDTAGKAHSEAIELNVEHYQLHLTDAIYENRVSGTTAIDFVSLLPSNAYQQVTLDLVPFVVGERQAPQKLYTGNTLPQGFTLDTLQYADGAYDLDVTVTTTSGVHYLHSQRIVIKNWNLLEDTIQPPTSPSSWFGIYERLLTVERSDGWQYANQTPETFFGDATRIRPETSGSQYLTWEHAYLKRFGFTWYAQAVNMESIVTVSVSNDGKTWTAVPYTVQVQEQANGWSKVLISGELAVALDAGLIRLAVDMSNTQVGTVELGNALLYGLVK